MRLAEAGYVVAAPDLFWRFAPGWRADHDEAGLQASFEQVGRFDFAQGTADAVAALIALGDLPDVAGRPGVLGFCLGGTIAWAVAAAGDPSCCVSYYGSGVPGMLGLADDVRCPVLFHFGDEDGYIPAEGIEAVNELIGTHRTSRSTSRSPATPSTTTSRRCSISRRPRRRPGRRRWRSWNAACPGSAGRRRARQSNSPGMSPPPSGRGAGSPR